MKNSIDLYLISGFLGSGKTTFLQKMLENFEGKKVGVIINEFGSIGIDGRLIEKDGIQLVEINNGSIFCSCLKGGFIKALIEFSKEDIDLLIIENSGMADPSNMHQILDELGNMVVRPYEYKGSICIVDSVSFLKYIRVLAPVQNQIASSNFVIVNKIDLVNQSTLIEIEEKIHEINSHAFICQAMFSEVPIHVLNENLLDNGYVGETSNQPSNRPATYSLESEGDFTEKEMSDFIQKIGSYVLRMKGFLKGESGWWQVDVIGDYSKIIEIQLGKRDIIKRTKLVIIGKNTEDFKSLIIETWKDIFQTKLEIYDDFDDCQKSNGAC